MDPDFRLAEKTDSCNRRSADTCDDCERVVELRLVADYGWGIAGAI
jgi:hypothetical protein